MTVVYYIWNPETKLIKIGVSSQVKTRLRKLRNETGVQALYVLATEQAWPYMKPYKLEDIRHKQFADHRVHGEWFAVSDELMDHIADLNEVAA